MKIDLQIMLSKKSIQLDLYIALNNDNLVNQVIINN